MRILVKLSAIGREVYFIYLHTNKDVLPKKWEARDLALLYLGGRSYVKGFNVLIKALELLGNIRFI